MKKVLFITFLGLLLCCKNESTTPHSAKEKADSNAKETVESPPDSEEIEPEILLGKQDRQALKKSPYNTWFDTNYEAYTIDTTSVKKLIPYLKNITIKAFIGTWCEDSQREIPTLYKILDATNFDYKKLELVTVSREKDTPDKFEEGLNILMVPTFIFYKDGKEMGRYVEFARETLEKDMLTIVSEQSYKHSYEN
ncbi:thioredoxin family protein [Aquimarina pacifica]|uniref:thioredoxin family protein n=1 Tax=Aquimarina pacifica TaxID=1296415 RepID=UPI0004706230|nr:thioredoxin family protein [Aquimarina pacifica]